MTCSDRCRFAKSVICHCSCGGVNHGAKQKYEEDALAEIYLTEEEAQPFREQINRHDCWCGFKKIHKLHIYGYKHSAGWEVRNDKYWLWITCPKCGHEWSLIKLGVQKQKV